MRIITTLLFLTFIAVGAETISTTRGRSGSILTLIQSNPFSNEFLLWLVILGIPVILCITIFVLCARLNRSNALGQTFRADNERIHSALHLIGGNRADLDISPTYLPGVSDTAGKLLALEAAIGGTEQQMAYLEQARQADGGYLAKLATLQARETALRARLSVAAQQTTAVEQAILAAEELLKKHARSVETLVGESDDGLHERMQVLEDAESELRAKLKTAETEFARIGTLHSALEALQPQIDVLNHEETGFNARYNNVSDKLDEWKEALEEMNRGVDNDTVEGDVDDMDTKKGEIIDLLNGLNEQFARLAVLRKEVLETIASAAKTPEVPEGPPPAP